MIIGITGTSGSGKGTIAEYLIKQRNFKHYSARAFIVEEIVRRGLTVDRNSMIEVANDLRAKHGPACVVEELYRQALACEGDSIIESIRSVGEVEAMKGKKDFYLLAVDANINLRYERILSRGNATDGVSFEQFVEQERREMGSTDPNKQNIAECIRLADYLVVNDDSVEDLNKKIEEILQIITNQ
jgi:dephospho-CoA kinase